MSNSGKAKKKGGEIKGGGSLLPSPYVGRVEGGYRTQQGLLADRYGRKRTFR